MQRAEGGSGFRQMILNRGYRQLERVFLKFRKPIRHADEVPNPHFIGRTFKLGERFDIGGAGIHRGFDFNGMKFSVFENHEIDLVLMVVAVIVEFRLPVMVVKALYDFIDAVRLKESAGEIA